MVFTLSGTLHPALETPLCLQSAGSLFNICVCKLLTVFNLLLYDAFNSACMGWDGFTIINPVFMV